MQSSAGRSERFFEGALARIERCIMVLGVAGVIGLAAVWGWLAAAGFAVGCGVGWLNFHWLGLAMNELAERTMARSATGEGSVQRPVSTGASGWEIGPTPESVARADGLAGADSEGRAATESSPGSSAQSARNTGARAAGASTAGTVARFLLRYVLIGATAYVIFKSSTAAGQGALAGLFVPIAAVMCEGVYEGFMALRRGM